MAGPSKQEDLGKQAGGPGIVQLIQQLAMGWATEGSEFKLW
jgi:hypothetical protein